MKNTGNARPIKVFRHTILLGILASLSHFAYEISGKNPVVGLFNPVNESIWEHLKFMFFPFIIWWIIIYKMNSNKYKISFQTWIFTASISLFVAPLSVVFLYYGYTGTTGFESGFIDILIAFISYFIALSLASHLLNYLEPSKWATITLVVLIVMVTIMFIVFTDNSPDFPIFYY